MGFASNDDSVEAFFASLEKVVRRGAWLGLLAYSTRLLGLPESVFAVAIAIVNIYLTIAAGWLIWRAIDAVVESLRALSRKYASEDNLLRYYDQLDHLVPLLRRTLEWAIYVSVASLVALQIEPISGFAADWWLRLIRIIGIVFLSRVIVEITRLVSEEILIKRARLDDEQRQRRLTLIPLIQSGLEYLIYFGAALVVLEDLGIDPGPALAAAGIAGLAIGLGAQNVINDLVSGFFTLFEDHFLVGRLRRGRRGRGHCRAHRSAHDLDPRRRRQAAHRAQRQHRQGAALLEAVLGRGRRGPSGLRQRPRSGVLGAGGDLEAAGEEEGDVLAPSEIRGLEEFSETGMVIEIETQVKPGRHLDLARDIRRRIKDAFDREGIEIPYLRQVQLQGSERRDSV